MMKIPFIIDVIFIIVYLLIPFIIDVNAINKERKSSKGKIREKREKRGEIQQRKGKKKKSVLLANSSFRYNK